ncbi:hypothetical protein SAMN05216228_10458 [Rhizobium tibeticum]|uniref:Uncharacterized protein n=1 Tax=Rhizobium tibeticum TaxID=501024 RepID=A0A1H8VND6_9HYPH|nr:hypothetical protein [Rhizobium tibeticum]SEI19201.1 hypothetical protein RTCCBAU85039_6102 [Rhizobium tibeticum]SEP16926.1 hypothetical protein SAMN05216228_10458 [Rhizobium tibeticum]
MNRVTNFTMAAIISSFAFAGASYAEDSVVMNGGPQIEKTLTTFNKAFDVKYLNDYQNQKDQPDAQDTAIPRSEDGVKNIQASIRENKRLVEKLAAKDIKVDDVVNAQQAADGSITFFIR